MRPSAVRRTAVVAVGDVVSAAMRSDTNFGNGCVFKPPKRTERVVAHNPRRLPNVSATALGSYPLWTMQSVHFGLPDAQPYESQSVVSSNSWNVAA